MAEHRDEMLPGDAPGDPRGATVLVVDDEEFVREAFRLYFQTLGFRTLTAAGGEGALQTFEAEAGRIDVVILDLVMPGMHGLDVLRRLKQVDDSVEVVIATGCGSVHSAFDALRLGAFDYVTKPVIDLDEDLLGAVQAALASRRAKLAQPAGGGGALEKGGPPEAGRIRFYEDLEALAARLLEPLEPEEALSLLGEILEHHLRAEAAALLAPDARGEAAVATWGDPDGASARGLESVRIPLRLAAADGAKEGRPAEGALVVHTKDGGVSRGRLALLGLLAERILIGLESRSLAAPELKG
ncbi:MAG: response regulator [Planctomycetes bacterium]|nr:response regulator [Planctomycetota bacterium]